MKRLGFSVQPFKLRTPRTTKPSATHIAWVIVCQFGVWYNTYSMPLRGTSAFAYDYGHVPITMNADRTALTADCNINAFAHQLGFTFELDFSPANRKPQQPAAPAPAPAAAAPVGAPADDAAPIR